MSRSKETLERFFDFRYEVVLEGACVGALAGVAVSLLRLFMGKLSGLNDQIRAAAAKDPAMWGVFALLVAAAFAITLIALKFAPLSSGSGIPQVKGELIGKVFQPWERVLPAKLISTAVCLGAGLSMGNEGPSVQLGAMAAKGFSRLLHRMPTEEKVLITAGSGAGLSCAFNAPMAGVLFALEDIRGALSPDILSASMAAAIVSNLVSYNIFGLAPVLRIEVPGALPLRSYWMILLLGAVLGALGVFFNRFTDFMQDQYAKIPSKIVRMMIPFVLLFLAAIFMPRVMGTGYSLIADASAGKLLMGALAATVVVKFLYSMICTNSGVPGGIFLPLLVIGALNGGIWFWAFGHAAGLDDAYLANFVILGMVGYFVAVIRAPLTGVILITELTGNFTNFLSLTVVALTATIVADILHGEPIYEQMLARLIRGQSAEPAEDEENALHKVILESDVFLASDMDGRRVSEMELPPGCLLVSVIHEGKEVVPNGSTVLHGGDKVALICNERDEYTVEKLIKRQLRISRIK